MSFPSLSEHGDLPLRGGGTSLSQPKALMGIAPGSEGELSLGDYWRILIKRKKTLAATVLLAVAAVGLYSVWMTPEYEVVARIAVYNDNPRALVVRDKKSARRVAKNATVGITTHVQALKSDALAMQVIRDVGLDRDPQFNPGGKKTDFDHGVFGAPYDAGDAMAMIGRLHRDLSIARVPGTRLIELHYRGPDPRVDAKIVNTLAADYIEQNFRTRYETTMQASEWLSRQLVGMQLNVEESQAKLAEYQKENGILGFDDKNNTVTARLDDLNKELTAAQADRIAKEANYNLLKSGSPEQIPGAVEQTSLISMLRGQQAKLQQEYAKTRVEFGPQEPRTLELQGQLAQVQAGIAGEEQALATKVTNEYQVAAAREQLLRAALDQQKAAANALNEKAIQYNLLKREAETNQQLYDHLLTKLKETEVNAELQSGNVRIIDRARIPESPASPNIPRNLIIALFFGLSCGVSLSIVLEALDNTVRTPEQVRSISDLPALGMIPLGARPPVRVRRVKQVPVEIRVPRRDRVELVTSARARPELAEFYRALRTSILLSSPEHPPKVILVTSALPQEGKTATSINSAIVLAQKGARVLLIDADLRCPDVHRHLGIRTRSGLGTLLAGRDALKHVVLPSRLSPNLFVLPAGLPPSRPAELLGSVRMKDVLAECRERFDHIIIDSPPVLSVTDAVELAEDVDTVMLVLRSGRTTRNDLLRARDLLRQAHTGAIGVVINGVDLRSPEGRHYCSVHQGKPYWDDLAQAS